MSDLSEKKKGTDITDTFLLKQTNKEVKWEEQWKISSIKKNAIPKIKIRLQEINEAILLVNIYT